MNSNRPKIFITIILMTFIECSHSAIKNRETPQPIEKPRPAEAPNPIVTDHGDYPHFEEIKYVENDTMGFKFNRFNYANPFSPNYNYDYSIPKECRVTIDIFKVTHEKIDSFDFGTKQPGFYKFRWNPYYLNNGIYYLKLYACDFADSAKVLVLK